MVSELIIRTTDGKEIGRINANVTPILMVELTNTTIGSRNFTIQINYDWNKNTQSRDTGKVKGVILK